MYASRVPFFIFSYMVEINLKSYLVIVGNTFQISYLCIVNAPRHGVVFNQHNVRHPACPESPGFLYKSSANHKRHIHGFFPLLTSSVMNKLLNKSEDM